MIFISDVQYYVSLKLCKAAGGIHLSNIRGMLKPEKVKLLEITFEILWK